MCYISIHLQNGKSFKHFHTNWNSKNADFTIGGFLASFPLSPPILCLLIKDIPNNLEIINALDIQPTDFLVFIKNHRHNHNNNHRYQQPTTKNLAKPSNPLPPRNLATHYHQETPPSQNPPLKPASPIQHTTKTH